MSGVPDDGDYAIELSGTEAFIVPLKYRGNHPITIELVACAASLRPSNICSNQQGSGLGIGLNAEGRWYLRVHDGGEYKAVNSDLPAIVNRRVHIAGMFDGRSLTLAIEGVIQKDPAHVDAHRDSGRPFLIGANPDSRNKPDDLFRGVIDEVRISDIVRYTKNFTPETRFTPDSHTLVLYHFDEGKGVIANDASGHNRHATLWGDECWCGATARWNYSAQYERFRALLAEIREQQGLSRQQLAARLSRPVAFVAGYETGSRSLDAVALRSVARALGVEAAALINRTNGKR